MTSTGPERGRPRLPQTDRRILDAALALLRERGPAALTIEAVSVASGVARSTIYRRYRDRRDLVAATLDELVPGPLPPPDLPMDAKLRWILDEVGDLVENSVGRGGVAAVLSDTDPDFTGALRGRIGDRLGALRSLMDDDLTSGALASWVDPEALADLLLGAYLGEVLQHGRARPGWADGVIELLGRAVTGAR